MKQVIILSMVTVTDFKRIGMFLGQIVFNMLAQKYLGDLGKSQVV